MCGSRRAEVVAMRAAYCPRRVGCCGDVGEDLVDIHALDLHGARGRFADVALGPDAAGLAAVAEVFEVRRAAAFVLQCLAYVFGIGEGPGGVLDFGAGRGGRPWFVQAHAERRWDGEEESEQAQGLEGSHGWKALAVYGDS